MLSLRSYQIKNIFVFIIIFFSYFNYSQNDLLLNKQISDINNYLKRCESLNDTASKESELIARQALHISRLVSDKSYFYRSMLALSKALWAQGRQNLSANYIDSLVNMTKSIKDYNILGDIYFVQGRYDHYRGDHAKALKNYLEALSYSERARDIVKVGEVSNTIGGIYYNQNNGKVAYEWYRKSLAIQFQQKNLFRIGRGYLNAGSALIILDNLKQAKCYLDSSLYYYSSIHSLEGTSYVYGTLPLIFIRQNQTDSALKYLLLAREVTFQINKLYSLPEINLQIATIYLDKGDYSKSLKYADEGLMYCRQTRQNFTQLTLYQIKAKVYERKGQFKEALESHKLYKIYSDSVLNNESTRKQTEAALQYEYNKKQYEDKLKADKLEMQRKEEENKRDIFFYSLLTFSTLMLIVIYWRYRLKKKTSATLEVTNIKLKEKNIIIEEKSKQLQESLGERELLLKEIHHRVKNNLQVISGLLELQKEELTEESSKLAFDEGQSRVRSISLIHQNLYQNENLGSINFKSFVTDLSLQVKEVFEQMDYKMNISIDMPDKIVDIDTAVPLGLIVNELLTNSYKYATVKGKIGKIGIQLEDLRNGNYVLNYTDSGPGIKNGINFDNSTTLGLRLIKGLAGQLAGKAMHKNEGVSTFIIWFKDTNARQGE